MATIVPTLTRKSVDADSDDDAVVVADAPTDSDAETVTESDAAATDSDADTDTADADTDADDTDADTAADATAEDDSPGATPRRRWWAAAMSVLLIVAIGGGVWAGFLYREHRQVAADAQRDELIVATTRQMVANLVTLRYSSADADVKRIQAGTTGDFKNQFGDTTGSFAAVLKEGKVDSTGAATSVALIGADDDSAQAIAAVTSTVKNSEAPQGQQRVYRMKVDLTKQGDRWLVSNMEFVS